MTWFPSIAAEIPRERSAPAFVITGNDDLAASCAWAPSGAAERAPLPIYPQPSDLATIGERA